MRTKKNQTILQARMAMTTNGGNKARLAYAELAKLH